MAKLIVADDHPLFRNALINAISNTFITKATIETDCFEATCQALEQHPDTDLLLLDLHMPGNCGFLGLIQLRKNYPALPIVVISASDDPDVLVPRKMDPGPLFPWDAVLRTTPLERLPP